MSAMPPKQLPSHNRDAERALLSLMLRDCLLPPDVVPLVGAEDFHIYAHRLIFASIMRLSSEGKNADLVTVSEFLTKQKQLTDAGGDDYLVELWEAPRSAASYRHYANTIREHSITRRMVHAGNEIVARASDPGAEPTELLGNAERLILDIAERTVGDQTLPIEDVVRSVYERLDARRSRDGCDGSVPTGFIELDAILSGLQPSELTILAARPSVGKTALSLAFSINAIDNGVPVLFFSLEQTSVSLAERMLCSRARVDGHLMRKGFLTDSQRSAIMRAGDELTQAPLLYIDDRPGQTMLQISANARRMKRRKGIKMVVIDYLQLIEPESTRISRNEQVAGISRRLQLLARELKVPVLALSQLNRSSEEGSGREPRLSDLRDSGAIEQDADTVVFLHRPERTESDFEAIDIIVAKQRNGPTGRTKLIYQKCYMRFENMMMEHRAIGGGL